MVTLTENDDNKSTTRRRRGRKGAEGGGRKEQTDNRVLKQDNANDAATSASLSLTFKPHKSILVHLTEETPTWYECGRHTAGRDDTIFIVDSNNKDDGGGKRQQSRKVTSNSPHLVEKFETLAEQIYQHELELLKSQSSDGGGEGGGVKSSDERWVENTMRRGTLKDRVAAMSVTVSSDPVHKLYALDMLLDMCGCSVTGGNNSQPNARVGQMAAEAILDLFLNTLLPPHRKLVPFSARPLYLYESSGSRTLSPRLLLLWHYEALIKKRYASFLSNYLGRTLASDSSLDEYKRMALQTATDLLRDVPEGESTLLSMIANKLGDPSRKIASCAGHQLRMVLEKHPAMIQVIAREVQQLAHRPHLSSRALYNCIIFLNQLKLVKEEDDDIDNVDDDSDKKKQRRDTPSSLPASLINTYFRLFEVAIKKGKTTKNGGNNMVEGDDAGVKSRLLSALLTGVNRSHPFLPRKDAAMEKHVDALYKIAHTAPPAASTQALMLLFNLAVGTHSGGSTGPGPKSDAYNARMDRFYRALYSKVGDPSMLVGRQLTMFFNLVYKATKHDPDGVRSVALAKRLLHTSAHSSAPIIAGTLFLVSEVMKTQSTLMESVSIASPAIYDPTKREPKAAFRASGSSWVPTNIDKDREGIAGSLWEVSLLSHHFHPSVSKFGESIGNIDYTGDPLRDFALAPFLDKFAYRNPKSVERISRHIKRGESIAERRSGIEGGIHMATSPPVNDPSFIKNEKIGEQEEFFRKFFVERAKRDEIKGIVRGTNDATGADDVLDAVESGQVDKLDEDWDTDPEEEEFATALAEKLIEQHSHGKAHFDDEDPEMEGWSDLDSESDGDDSEGKNPNGIIGGDSAVIDDDDDISLQSDNDSDEHIKGGIIGDGDDFMDDDDDSDSNDSIVNDIKAKGMGRERELVSIDDNSDGDDSNHTGKQGGTRKKQQFSDNFADASEYEALIVKGWSEATKGRHLDNSGELVDGIDKDTARRQNQDGDGKKQRKKRKQKR